MNKPTTPRIIEAHWSQDREQILAIRHAVFVLEQKVPAELEEDGEDERCHHVLGFHPDHPEPVATARLLPDSRIGRMAVLHQWRTHGLGGAMLQKLLLIAQREQLPSPWLSAQQHAIPFYRKHGFTPEGPTYQDAGIPHRTMRLRTK